MQLTQTSLNLLIIDCYGVKGVNTHGELRPCGLRDVYLPIPLLHIPANQMAAFEFPQQSNVVYISELLKKIDRDKG